MGVSEYETTHQTSTILLFTFQALLIIRINQQSYFLLIQTHPSTSAKQSPALTDRVSLIKDYRNIQSSRHDTDVETRSPAEAQNIPGGRGQRTPKLPSDSWKHPNTALIKESVNYKTKVRGQCIY